MHTFLRSAMHFQGHVDWPVLLSWVVVPHCPPLSPQAKEAPDLSTKTASLSSRQSTTQEETNKHWHILNECWTLTVRPQRSDSEQLTKHWQNKAQCMTFFYLLCSFPLWWKHVKYNNNKIILSNLTFTVYMEHILLFCVINIVGLKHDETKINFL